MEFLQQRTKTTGQQFSVPIRRVPIYWAPADVSGKPERLLASETQTIPDSAGGSPSHIWMLAASQADGRKRFLVITGVVRENPPIPQPITC